MVQTPTLSDGYSRDSGGFTRTCCDMTHLLSTDPVYSETRARSGNRPSKVRYRTHHRPTNGWTRIRSRGQTPQSPERQTTTQGQTGRLKSLPQILRNSTAIGCDATSYKLFPITMIIFYPVNETFLSKLKTYCRDLIF